MTLSIALRRPATEDDANLWRAWLRWNDCEATVEGVGFEILITQKPGESYDARFLEWLEGSDVIKFYAVP
jgi:hypothetical protein